MGKEGTPGYVGLELGSESPALVGGRGAEEKVGSGLFFQEPLKVLLLMSPIQSIQLVSCFSIYQRGWLLVGNVNQTPTVSIDSLIEGTWEWLGDYFPGKLFIGKSH